MRVECISVRRRYSRHIRRRRRDRNLDDQLLREYRQCVVTLQLAIRNAKDKAKKELLRSLNGDPWGRSYKLVRDKLRPWAPPLTQTLQPDLLDVVVTTLFPNAPEHEPPTMSVQSAQQMEFLDIPTISEAELNVAVLKIRGKSRAPGPDGIPGRVLVIAADFLGERFRRLFDSCLVSGQFPQCWKRGRLILLRKIGRSEESPNAYCPIVTFNETHKFFERIIADRLVKHLDMEGPNLSDNQYGFRRGRSTIDAIIRIKALSQQTVASGGVLLALSLDIENAFNTLPWTCIVEALAYHRVPNYLRNIIANYLLQREIVFLNAEGRMVTKVVSCGVPQGSVLGPLLWNIGYDWVLRCNLHPGARLTCYADDTLITVQGRTFMEAAQLASSTAEQVLQRVTLLGLSVALDKTNAICFHSPRRAPPRGSMISVYGVHVEIKPHLRYLGLILDSRWQFREHFSNLAPRLLRAAAALKRLMPNIGRPKSSSHRLYMEVVRSMVLYGAPVWVDTLSEKTVAQMRRPQRVMAISVIRGYHIKLRAFWLGLPHGIWRRSYMLPGINGAWSFASGVKTRQKWRWRGGWIWPDWI